MPKHKTPITDMLNSPLSSFDISLYQDGYCISSSAPDMIGTVYDHHSAHVHAQETETTQLSQEFQPEQTPAHPDTDGRVVLYGIHTNYTTNFQSFSKNSIKNNFNKKRSRSKFFPKKNDKQ